MFSFNLNNCSNNHSVVNIFPRVDKIRGRENRVESHLIFHEFSFCLNWVESILLKKIIISSPYFFYSNTADSLLLLATASPLLHHYRVHYHHILLLHCCGVCRHRCNLSLTLLQLVVTATTSLLFCCYSIWHCSCNLSPLQEQYQIKYIYV